MTKKAHLGTEKAHLSHRLRFLNSIFKRIENSKATNFGAKSFRVGKKTNKHAISSDQSTVFCVVHHKTTRTRNAHKDKGDSSMLDVVYFNSPRPNQKQRQHFKGGGAWGPQK